MNPGFYNANPITNCKLYKSIVLPSTLFGCELWSNLTITEKLMLERFQRFCGKSIQHLGRRARSDICIPMLGLPSVKSYIDNMTLSFFRRIMSLPSHCISRQIFLRRWYQYKVDTSVKHNFCSNLHDILVKYNLIDYVEEIIFRDNYVPDKLAWKRLCKREVSNVEKEEFKNRTDDPEFNLFHAIQPDIFDSNCLWYVAKAYKHKLFKCFAIAKYLTDPKAEFDILCEFCGRMYSDILMHKTMVCDKNVLNREKFWDNIINLFPVELSVFLNNLEDTHQLHILLGAPLTGLNIALSEEAYGSFLATCVDFIYECL